MVAISLACAWVIVRPPLFIENEPRLSGPCTVWESSITLGELVKRFSSVTGVRLVCAYPYPHTRLAVYASARPTARVLSLAANALDLDWVATNDGYKLILPKHIEELEGSYEREIARETTKRFAAKCAEWRKMRWIPWAQARRLYNILEAAQQAQSSRMPLSAEQQAVLNIPYHEATNLRAFALGAEALLVPFARAVGPEEFGRLAAGETVIATTAKIAGFPRLPGPPSRYATLPQESMGGVFDDLFLAVRLDPEGAGVLFKAWRVTRSPSHVGIPLGSLVESSYDFNPFHFRDTGLARRANAWCGGQWSSFTVGERFSRRDKSGRSLNDFELPPATSFGELARTFARVAGTTLVIVRPPEQRSLGYATGTLRIASIWRLLNDALGEGQWHVEPDCMLWRPANYRYRADMAKGRIRAGENVICASSPAAALAEYLASLAVGRQPYREIGYGPAPQWRKGRMCAAVAAFIGLLGENRLESAITYADLKGGGHRTIAPTKAVAAGIPIASLEAPLRAAALDAIRTLCLTGADVTPQTQKDWLALLGPEPPKSVRFFVFATRNDVVCLKRSGGGSGTDGLPSPDDWRRRLALEAGTELSLERNWEFAIGFGVPGGPIIYDRTRYAGRVFGASASELAARPDQVYERLVTEMRRGMPRVAAGAKPATPR